MSTMEGDLGVLDETGVSRELDLVSKLFHRINKIIPEKQKILSFPPEMSAREAIAILRVHGYSQAPVIAAGEVLGVFSYRSFALKAGTIELQQINSHKTAPGDFSVEECLEQFEFARVTEEMRRVFSAMDRDNGVLIGAPEKLQGILTPMDFLHYLYRVASPFVLISEIELTLRELMRLAATKEQLLDLARHSLAHIYRDKKLPTALEDMSLDNYRSIIINGDNWVTFSPILGANRAIASAKLKQVSDLRNAIFHFKREITLEDHEILSDIRDWLLLKAKQADLKRKMGPNNAAV